MGYLTHWFGESDMCRDRSWSWNAAQIIAHYFCKKNEIGLISLKNWSKTLNSRCDTVIANKYLNWWIFYFYKIIDLKAVFQLSWGFQSQKLISNEAWRWFDEKGKLPVWLDECFLVTAEGLELTGIYDVVMSRRHCRWSLSIAVDKPRNRNRTPPDAVPILPCNSMRLISAENARRNSITTSFLLLKKKSRKFRIKSDHQLQNVIHELVDFLLKRLHSFLILSGFSEGL